MIKFAEDLSIYDLSFFEDDIFFQRIYSDFSTISKFNNVYFYICEEHYEITAVISKVNDIITISAKESANFEEMNEFVKVIGFTTVLCDNDYSCHFDGEKTSGKILKFNSNYEHSEKANTLDVEHLPDMYKLVKKVFDTSADFSDWFVDICHKMRYGSADLCGVYDDKMLISAGFSLFITEKSAVISSVVTDEEFRHKGYGERVVKTLLEKNIGKDVFVFTENKNAENWYKNMDFVPCKMWSEIKNVL